MGLKYFLDTYAIYEIISGSTSYNRYWGSETATSIFNIAESYYIFLRELGEDIADEKTIPLFLNALSIRPLTIKEAMKFRLENKKKDLSYTDCIGYQLAKENHMKFLTGDIQFKGLPNVEFVK